MKPAPMRPPVTLPAFEMDIRVANSVASTPDGHNLAAKTRTGMNDACITDQDLNYILCEKIRKLTTFRTAKGLIS